MPVSVAGGLLTTLGWAGTYGATLAAGAALWRLLNGPRGWEEKIKAITGMECKQVDENQKENRVRIEFSDVTLTEVTRNQELIDVTLDVMSKAWIDRGKIIMDIWYAKIPKEIKWQDLHSRVIKDFRKEVIIVGCSHRGVETLDLATMPTPHFLIAGATGGGKSAFLRQLVTTLAMVSRSTRPMFTIVDLKGGVEFADLAEIDPVSFTVSDDLDSTLTLLQELNVNLDERIKILRSHRLKSWNSTLGPRRIFIVDELADINPDDAPSRSETRTKRQEAHAMLTRLLRLGRAAGINVILATQRPDAKVVPGEMKANIGATICFRMHDRINSELVLGTGIAAHLPPFAGRGILKYGENIEFQAPWLDAESSERLLKQRSRNVL